MLINQLVEILNRENLIGNGDVLMQVRTSDGQLITSPIINFRVTKVKTDSGEMNRLILINPKKPRSGNE